MFNDEPAFKPLPEIDVEHYYSEANNGAELEIEEEAEVEDMIFTGEMELRVYLSIRDALPKFLDFSIVDKLPELTTAKKWEDKSIFKLGTKFIKHHEQLQKFLKTEESQGSIFKFPGRDPRTICILRKDEHGDPYFYLYDIF